MGYTLTLTESDLKAAHFVGDSYAWSAALIRLCDVGENNVAEHDAWSLRDAFEADMEGGHSAFPMLDHRCELAEKLFSFWWAII